MEQNMKFNIPKRISPFLEYLLLSGALLYIVVYLYLAFFRIYYPFELEWMEGASVDHVRRILSGQKLYVNPSLEFTPHNYTPIYFYISALVSSIVGIGFMPLRLVSFVSSLGCFLVIFLFVKQETKNINSSFLATGIFAATFRIGGAWFDVARIDSLFLFLLLIAIYLIKFKTSPTYWVLAGVFISLSFLTKQTALAITLPIIVYCLFVNWRRALFFIGTIAVIIGGSTLLLDYMHEGWYSYYVFALPTQHSIRHQNQWLGFWQKDIILPLAIAFCMSIFYIFSQLFSASKTKGVFYSLATIGMLGGTWFSRVHAGAYNNTLLPAYAIISIISGLAIHKIFEVIQKLSPAQQDLMRMYVYFLCIIQFLALLYNPFKQLPTEKDLQAGKKLVSMMAQIQGDVLLPRHGYLPVLAGKESAAQEIAINDILRCNDENPRTKLLQTKLFHEIKTTIMKQRYQAIILDHKGWFSDIIEEYYIQQGQVFENNEAFWPVTGYKTRPEFIYVPRKQ